MEDINRHKGLGSARDSSTKKLESFGFHSDHGPHRHVSFRMGHVSDLGSLPLKDNLWYILSLLAIGSMYGIYANIWGILMVNVTIYSIHGSYGLAYGFPLG